MGCIALVGREDKNPCGRMPVRGRSNLCHECANDKADQLIALLTHLSSTQETPENKAALNTVAVESAEFIQLVSSEP